MPDTTCGTHFRQMLLEYGLTDPEAIRHVAMGQCHGLAAKVALGACPAAMVRPGPAYEEMVRQILPREAARVGVRWALVAYPARAPAADQATVLEYWLYRDEPHIAEAMAWIQTQYIAPYSPLWHRLRGWLCGIPDDQLDERYHERPGHHEACEPEVRSREDGDGEVS